MIVHYGTVMDGTGMSRLSGWAIYHQSDQYHQPIDGTFLSRLWNGISSQLSAGSWKL